MPRVKCLRTSEVNRIYCQTVPTVQPRPYVGTGGQHLSDQYNLHSWPLRQDKMAGLILTTLLIIAWTIALVWFLARLTSNRLERRKIIRSVVAVHLLWWLALHGLLTLALRSRDAHVGRGAGLVDKVAEDYFDRNGPLCPSSLFSVPLVPLVVAVSEDNYRPRYTRENKIRCKREYGDVSIYLLVFKIPLLRVNEVENPD